MFADERFAAAAEQAAKNERDRDGVVKLAGDGDEVGYEVEGKCEVAGKRDQQELLAARDARVAK